MGIIFHADEILQILVKQMPFCLPVRIQVQVCRLKSPEVLDGDMNVDNRRVFPRRCAAPSQEKGRLGEGAEGVVEGCAQAGALLHPAAQELPCAGIRRVPVRLLSQRHQKVSGIQPMEIPDNAWEFHRLIAGG